MSDVCSYVFASTKGGVGKTTTTANVGGILADLGHRVLFIDADIQPALSSYYPLVDRAPHGLTQLFQTASVEGCISRTDVGCDIVLSDDPAGELSTWIRSTPDGMSRLKRAVAAATDYDVVLIDTQGTVSALQEAAVLAADSIVCPVPPTMLSAREFTRGTLGMLERLQPMAYMNLPLGRLYALIYMMDRTNDAQLIADEVREQFEAEGASCKAFSVLRTEVPVSNAFKKAATRGMPAHLIERTRRGPSPSARARMLALVGELYPCAGATLRSDAGTRRVAGTAA